MIKECGEITWFIDENGLTFYIDGKGMKFDDFIEWVKLLHNKTVRQGLLAVTFQENENVGKSEA